MSFRFVVVAVLAGGALCALGFILAGSEARAPRAAAAKLATATVRRGDLIDEQVLNGTLGYGRARTLTAASNGVVTGLPHPGARRTRGESLYELDGEARAFLFYGAEPAWRRLEPGDEGSDVRQLEQNLRALGFDPYGEMLVDGYYGAATADAVERFQRAHGMETDGVVEFGEVVFLPRAVRISGQSAALGEQVAPGAPVVEVTGTRQVVSVALDAERQGLVRRGQRARVELPDGRTVAGRVTRIGRVAEGGDENEGAKISVSVSLRGRAPAFDQAPVGVRVERRVARGRLLIPIRALLARRDGGYAVEVVRGTRHRLVPVRTGAFATGYVEVVSGSLREGDTVSVAR